MKKILTAAVAAAAMITASCDVERLPNGSMSAEQVTGNPEASLDALMNGVYAQLKTWSDPMHRCGEYAGDNMMIRGNSTDAFFEFSLFPWDYAAASLILTEAGGALCTMEGEPVPIDRRCSVWAANRVNFPILKELEF